MTFDSIKRAPLILFSLYFAKVLCLSAPTWTDGAILLVLAGLAGFYEAWSQLKLMQKLNEDFKKLEENQKILDKANKDLQNHVSGLKIAQTVRMGGNVR